MGSIVGGFLGQAAGDIFQVFAICTLLLGLPTWAWSYSMDLRDKPRGTAVERGREMSAISFNIGVLFNFVELVPNRDIDHWAFVTPRFFVGLWFIVSIWYWFFSEFRRSRQPVRRSARAI